MTTDVRGGGRYPDEGWQEMRSRGTFNTTDEVIHYQAANGHTMAYYEDASRPGKPARQCAWEGWHSDRCQCTQESDQTDDS